MVALVVARNPSEFFLRSPPKTSTRESSKIDPIRLQNPTQNEQGQLPTARKRKGDSKATGGQLQGFLEFLEHLRRSARVARFARSRASLAQRVGNIRGNPFKSKAIPNRREQQETMRAQGDLPKSSPKDSKIDPKLTKKLHQKSRK